ncbi:hypothetical protein [Herbidospora mongoliensis]|nr:hypothetical protein [Herbidospora mongoliensis]
MTITVVIVGLLAGVRLNGPMAYAVVFALACLVAGLGVLFLTAFGRPS